jgi:hypothetical protein
MWLLMIFLKTAILYAVKNVSDVSHLIRVMYRVSLDERYYFNKNMQCCGSGSGIQCCGFGIRDGKKSSSGIQEKEPRSYFRLWIWDRKILIRDYHPQSATLNLSMVRFFNLLANQTVINLGLLYDLTNFQKFGNTALF